MLILPFMGYKPLVAPHALAVIPSLAVVIGALVEKWMKYESGTLHEPPVKFNST